MNVFKKHKLTQFDQFNSVRVRGVDIGFCCSHWKRNPINRDHSAHLTMNIYTVEKFVHLV